MITFKEKVGYGFGDMASSMFWKIFGMYLLFFYTRVFGLSPAAVGTMFFVVRLLDAVINPAMGVLVDRTRTRWGSYRPYLLWFAIPFSIMGVVTFYIPDLSNTGKLIYAYVTYTLMWLVYTTINVPYASLLGVMSEKPGERNILASYRMLYAFVGSFITFMLFQPMVDFFASFFNKSTVLSYQVVGDDASISKNPLGWLFAVVVIAIICAVLFFFCFLWTRERIKPRKGEVQASVKQDFLNLLGNKPWWILMVSGALAIFFNALRDGVAIFYFSDYVQAHYKIPYFGWTIATVYLLIGQVANMIGVALAAPLSNKYGKKRTYITAMLLTAIFSSVFFMVKPNQLILIMLMQIVISICAGYVLPLLWSMSADVADHQELKTGRRITGLIFSTSSMSQKLGAALGTALIGWLLAWYGYNQDASNQTEYTIHGIRSIISWLPALSCILSLISMAYYPLADEKVEKNASELEKKRRGKA